MPDNHYWNTETAPTDTMLSYEELPRRYSAESLPRVSSPSVASEVPSLPWDPPPSLASEVSTVPLSSPRPTYRLRPELRRLPSTYSHPSSPPPSVASEASSLPWDPPPSLTSKVPTVPPSSPSPTHRLRRELRRLSRTYSLPTNPPPSLVSEVPSPPRNPPPSLVSEASHLPTNPAPSLATGVSSLSPPNLPQAGLPRRGRRRPSSSDSLPGARIPSSASGVFSILSETPPPVYQPVHEASRRDKQLRAILRRTANVFQAFTSVIPLALVALVVYVYVAAHHGVWRQLNTSHNDPRSKSWAPFWLAMAYVGPLYPNKAPQQR